MASVLYCISSGEPELIWIRQLRRQTRERREYIFKKSQESQERSIYERKQRIKELLAAGKPLPTELRSEVRKEGGRDLVLDEAQAGRPPFQVGREEAD